MKKCSYLFVLLFELLLIQTASAQETNVKDETTIIKIYIRLNYQDSMCTGCTDKLKVKLQAIKGSWNVKVFPVKKVITFYMYSSQVISEKELDELIKKAGLIPIRIEYLKEEPEDETDEPLTL